MPNVNNDTQNLIMLKNLMEAIKIKDYDGDVVSLNQDNNFSATLLDLAKSNFPGYSVKQDQLYLNDLQVSPLNKSVEAINRLLRLVQKSDTGNVGIDLGEWEEIKNDIKFYVKVGFVIKEHVDLEDEFKNVLNKIISALDQVSLESEGGALDFLQRYKDAVKKYVDIIDGHVLVSSTVPEVVVENISAFYDSDELKKAYIELFVCERISRNTGLFEKVNRFSDSSTKDYEMQINQRATRMAMPWEGLLKGNRPQIYKSIHEVMERQTQNSQLQIADVQMVSPVDFASFQDFNNLKSMDEINNFDAFVKFKHSGEVKNLKNPEDIHVKSSQVENIVTCYLLARKIAKFYRMPIEYQHENHDEINSLVHKFDRNYSEIELIVTSKLFSLSSQKRTGICEAIAATDGYIKKMSRDAGDDFNIDFNIAFEKASLAEEYIGYLLFTNKKIPLAKSYEIINEFVKNSVPITPLTKKILRENTDFGTGVRSTFDYLGMPIFIAKLSKLKVIDINPEPIYTINIDNIENQNTAKQDIIKPVDLVNSELDYTITDDHWDSIKNGVVNAVGLVNANMANNNISGAQRPFKFTENNADELIMARNNLAGEPEKQATLKRNYSNIQLSISNCAINSESGFDDAQKLLFINLLAKAKENSKDGTVTISNCSGRPKVARALYDMALESGMNPKYGQDGSDPRGILERKLQSSSKKRRLV